jgi:hypothetical protein
MCIGLVMSAPYLWKLLIIAGYRLPQTTRRTAHAECRRRSTGERNGVTSMD